ncbi:hypothetical protein KCP69_20240 [Salmonella enterica subsp. enterica]|nr:hypothetical protein KCP69_20240 [Salmonella enterica subsp. enterica]
MLPAIRPTVGSQPRSTEKSALTTFYAGKEMPVTASVIPNRSGQRLRHTAVAMPIAMPNRTAHIILVIVSHSVGKSGWRSSETGRRETIDVPKSP